LGCVLLAYVSRLFILVIFAGLLSLFTSQ